MKKINIIRLSLLTAVLSACGGAGGPSKPNVCSDLKLTHCDEVTIPVASSSSSASSEAPPVNAMLPLSENFAVSNATQFFNQAYKPLLNPNPQDPNNAFYYATSGLDAGRVVVADGKLTIGNARFTLGQRLQTTGTHIDPNPVTPIVDFKVGTTSDAAALNFPTSTTWGDLDLAHKWKISFCVPEAEALSGTTSNQQFMVYVDNNTSGSSFSIHGAKSLVKQLNVSAFVPGKRVEINVPGDILVGGKSIDSVLQNPGTTSSFIQLRVPSAGVVTMSQLWLGYQSDTSTEPSAASCTVGARVPNWNIALPPAVPVAPSFTPGNNQLTVSWPVAAGAVSYTLAWNTTNSPEGATLIEGVLGTSTTITGLQNGTTYYVFVKSVNTGGVSAYGPSAAGVPEAPAAAPATPTNLTLYGDSKRALVTWSPTEGAQSYALAVNTMNETSTASVIGDITGTYKRVNDLVNGTPYYFFVKAINAAGGSEYSAAKVITPLASPYIYQANLHVSRDKFFGLDSSGAAPVPGLAVQTVTADSEVPMHYIAGGGAGITVDETAGTIKLASGGRFTIGQYVEPGTVQTNTAASVVSTAGRLDLSGHYKIYITVVSAADNAGVLQVYLDNNMTASGSSIHGAKSRLLSRAASTIADGEVIVLDVSGANRLGSANSFIQLRTDSTIGVDGIVISDIHIEQVEAPVEVPSSSMSSSAAASDIASSVASSNGASSVAASSAASSDVASSVAASSVASSNVASSVAVSSASSSDVASSVVASSASSSAEASSVSSVASSASSASSVVAIVTRDWAFDSAAYAAADTSLFTATYTAAGDNNIKNTGDITVDGLIFNNTSATSVLRYRPAGSTGNASLLPLWNTNGSFFTSNSVLMPAIGSDIDTTKVRAYIGVPVVAGSEFTITVNYKQTGSGATAAKVALVGSDNKVLAVKDASYASAGGTAGDSITLTVPAGHAYSAIKIFYGRETLATGGINITSIQRLQ